MFKCLTGKLNIKQYVLLIAFFVATSHVLRYVLTWCTSNLAIKVLITSFLINEGQNYTKRVWNIMTNRFKWVKILAFSSNNPMKLKLLQIWTPVPPCFPFWEKLQSPCPSLACMCCPQSSCPQASETLGWAQPPCVHVCLAWLLPTWGVLWWVTQFHLLNILFTHIFNISWLRLVSRAWCLVIVMVSVWCEEVPALCYFLSHGSALWHPGVCPPRDTRPKTPRDCARGRGLWEKVGAFLKCFMHWQNICTI